MADLTQEQSSLSGGMTDLINATKGQALNTGALVQSNQNLATAANSQVTQATNLVTQTTNLVTQTTNLVAAVTNLTTAINNALSLGPWATWSPTIGSTSGTITTVGAVTARYIASGKTVYFSISITITTNGSGSGAVTATLPMTAKSLFIFIGRETVSTGNNLQGIISAGSSTMNILTSSGAYPGGTGYVLNVNGVYESQ